MENNTLTATLSDDTRSKFTAWCRAANRSEDDVRQELYLVTTNVEALSDPARAELWKIWRQTPDVETDYAYETLPPINEGEALINCTARRHGIEAGCLFTVSASGSTECDTSSDGCSENPFDSEGWPKPPADMIREARELASEE